MNANELRIGNLVLCNGLRTIINKELLIKILNNDIQYTIEPLKTTEELLLKFGLKKRMDFYVLYEWFYIDTHCGDLKNMFFFRPIDGFKSRLEYAHQLQNLYFALTNKELTYTP